MTAHATSTHKIAPAQPHSAPSPWASRTNLTILAAAVVLLTLIALGILWWRSPKAAPPMGSDIVTFTRFVTSSNVYQLPFERQRAFFERMDSRRKELAEAYKQHKLTREEVQAAVNVAWCGKQLYHMEKYFGLPEGQPREEYINRVADLKELKDRRKKGKNTATTTAPVAVVAAAEDDGLPKPDETTKEDFKKSWPPNISQQWQIFRDEVKKAERQIENDRRAAKRTASGKSPKKSGKKSGNKASKALTRPAIFD